MNIDALMTEFQARGIRAEPRPAGRLRLTPRARLTPELIEEARRLKTEILNRLQIDQALAVFERLKTFVLPTGRMPAALATGERLKPFLQVSEIDPSEALASLQAIESELRALGGTPDPEIAAAVATVRTIDPAARLVEVCRKVKPSR